MDTICGMLLSAAVASLEKVESVDERARVKSMLFEFAGVLGVLLLLVRFPATPQGADAQELLFQ